MYILGSSRNLNPSIQFINIHSSFKASGLDLNNIFIFMKNQQSKQILFLTDADKVQNDGENTN